MNKSYQKVIQNQKDELEQVDIDNLNQQTQTDDEVEQEIDRDIRVDFIKRIVNNARV